MVARIHFTVDARFLRCAAITAITMVKLLASNTTVITVEKIMDGLKGNGRGQFGLFSRAYVYAISNAEKVSVSETINSHIPSFFEPIANGEAPPDHGVETACDFTSCTVHRPRERSKR